YAAANACLDAMALSQRCHGRLSSSLQIPAVGGAGMGASTFDEAQFDAIGGISLDEFASRLADALTPWRAALERTQTPLARALLAATASMPVCSELIDATESSGVLERDANAGTASDAPPHSLAQLEPRMRVSAVESVILRALSVVVGESPDSLTLDTPLSEAGVDSIATRELARSLEQASGVTLSPSFIYEHETSRALAQHILLCLGLITDIIPPPSISERVLSNWGEIVEGADHIGSMIFRVSHASVVKPSPHYAKRPPLVFCHSIVGFAPIPSLRLLQKALDFLDVWLVCHPGYQDGTSFPDATIEEQAMVYARALCEECGDQPFDLTGVSFGASLAHHVGTAARGVDAFARRLILIDPNPAPPYVDAFFSSKCSPHKAAFNCIFGVFDNPSKMEAVTADISALAVEDLGAYVAMQYQSTGGMRGTTWDALLCGRQIKVYMHCSEMIKRSQEPIQPFTSIKGGATSSAIFLVRSSQRALFFAPLLMFDFCNNPKERVSANGRSDGDGGNRGSHSLSQYGPASIEVRAVCRRGPCTPSTLSLALPDSPMCLSMHRPRSQCHQSSTLAMWRSPFVSPLVGRSMRCPDLTPPYARCASRDATAALSRWLASFWIAQRRMIPP
ncbi:MAG: phosphopantetheine-binding protein, partial [Promethearchaeia archaeon]